MMVMKKNTRYNIMKNYEELMLNHPMKIYFSKLRIFSKVEWTEWIECLGQGIFYLGAGLLLLLWLVVRLLVYPLTRACVVYKCHKKAKRRYEKKMKKSIDNSGRI